VRLRVGAVLLISLLTVLAVGGQDYESLEEGVAPPSLVVGEPEGVPLSGEALERETARVGALIRCPVCQGLSVMDSPAPMAVNMRGQVAELLRLGYTDKQVLSYFERSYGEFVLLDPPLRGINWIVWMAPIVLLAVGIGVLGVIFGRRRDPSPGEPESADADADQAIEEDPYLQEVRRLAYGKSKES
jgi:cytochrome c-type biogenesis protein CcmH